MGPMETAAKRLAFATSAYISDLEAMTEDQVMKSAGGVARRPADFTYEVAIINKRITGRIEGGELPTVPAGDPWVVAPDDHRTKADVIAFFKESSDRLVAACSACSEEEGQVLVGKEGDQEPKYEMANFAWMHTLYHDAQLNLIQSLAGDNEMHWE